MPDDPQSRSALDLALNVPGKAARQQALILRSAAPTKTLLSRLLGAPTQERAWRDGTDGEENLADQLSALSDDWRMLHAVPVGRRGADIDHVLIGPAGVFTVNAKHHPDGRVWVGGDTVIVNGSRKPYLRNSKFEAYRAERLLSAACGFSVHVRAIVALVGTSSVTIK